MGSLIAEDSTSPSDWWPEPGSPGSLVASDFDRLKENDRADAVVEKLGPPTSSEVSLPWLYYYAADHRGKYYVVHFQHKREWKITGRSRVAFVILRDVSDPTADGVVVWPARMKEEESQKKKGEPGATDNPGDAQ